MDTSEFGVQNEDYQWLKTKECLEKKSKLYEQLATGRANCDGEDIMVDFSRVYKQEKNEEQNDEELQLDDSLLVEIVDEFGRTRKVPSSQAHLYQTSDSQLVDDDNAHYNALSENRKRGVGFFVFSRDEQQRSQQMNELNELRQTVTLFCFFVFFYHLIRQLKTGKRPYLHLAKVSISWKHWKGKSFYCNSSKSTKISE